MTAGSSGQMRASDSDRDNTTDWLRTAFAEGRLTKDEYDERIGQALTSKTYAELEALTADLPRKLPSIIAPAPAARAEPRTNPLAIAALACGLAGVFTSGLTSIPAIILGHIARGQIRRSGANGKGLATIGLALGWAAVAMAAIMTIAFTAMSARSGHPAPPLGPPGGPGG
jgi:Domain of unknown function (DUF1707)/Domain of unknown function (DUF4190)